VAEDLPVMKLGMQCVSGFDHNGKLSAQMEHKACELLNNMH
jgi:hypothetical protein